MAPKPHHHLTLSLLIAGGLSLYFGFTFGVEWRWMSFGLIAACALAGTGLGWLTGRRLWVTATATALLRVALFVGLRGAVT